MPRTLTACVRKGVVALKIPLTFVPSRTMTNSVSKLYCVFSFSVVYRNM